jgi:hypothetical protein
VFVHALRFWYRRAWLRLLPFRSYVLKSDLNTDQLRLELSRVVQPDPLYFMRSGSPDFPYSGRFRANSLVAVRNAQKPWQRRIKIRIQWQPKPQAEKGSIVRLQMSNPFSPFNVFYLGIVYGLYWWIYPQPFLNPWLNVLVWLLPIILMYAFTNASFQWIYRSEKAKVFRYLKAQRWVQYN